MLYVESGKLNVVQSVLEDKVVTFEALETIIGNHPSNAVYFVNGRGYLYGMITMGDVARAKKEESKSVIINRDYTKLASDKRVSEYMKALKLFKENERINTLPVVDLDGRLLGAYIRWDDFFTAQIGGSRRNGSFWSLIV